MPTRRKARFGVLLPATPCTEDMRKRMVEVADQWGESIAEVQREAFSLFLALNDSKSIIKESKSIKSKGRLSREANCNSV